jgi:hypothetical protein
MVTTMDSKVSCKYFIEGNIYCSIYAEADKSTGIGNKLTGAAVDVMHIHMMKELLILLVEFTVLNVMCS